RAVDAAGAWQARGQIAWQRVMASVQKRPSCDSAGSTEEIALSEIESEICEERGLLVAFDSLDHGVEMPTLEELGDRAQEPHVPRAAEPIFKERTVDLGDVERQ